MSGPISSANLEHSVHTRWRYRVTIAAVTVFALALYSFSAAPGLTWAHFGADGGELLAAAMTNGVPHPPGYPLYMVLLRAWLAITAFLSPTADLAWRGTLFSILCAACSAGVTVRVAFYFVRESEKNWLWAGLAGIGWSIASLPWSQALITEVYALHMLLVALLGWALFIKRRQPLWLFLIATLGIAHHLTFILLLPAVLYGCWFTRSKTTEAKTTEAKTTEAKTTEAKTADTSVQRKRLTWLLLLVLAGFAATLFHLRTPLAASATPPSPVNWGYPDNWEGFWWLVSGKAYRSYLFGAPSSTLLARVAAWASTLTAQLTPVGLAVMLSGLAHWDRQRPHLRNFSLLWLAPISIYAINYYTRDSEIYLLPVVWLTMLWFGVGLVTLVTWVYTELPRWQQSWLKNGRPIFGASKSRTPENVQPPAKNVGRTRLKERQSRNTTVLKAKTEDRPTEKGLTEDGLIYTSLSSLSAAISLVVFLGMIVLVGWRWSTISARADIRAVYFLQETIAVLQPHSIVVSSADAETFALWYGAWGSGELLDKYPDTVLINYALFQFPWYRRLLATQYPDVVGNSSSVEEILARNADRPIFFSEELSYWPPEQREAAGPIWRYIGP